MKPLLIPLNLLFFSTAFLSSLLFAGCAGVSPMGGALAGTDAEWIHLTGNAKTGDFSLEARGLNQSRSAELAAQSLEELTRLKIYSQVATTATSGVSNSAADSL